MNWIDLPWADLSPSVRVDILGIYAYRKPAIRIAVGDTAIAACTAAAFTGVGWASTQDEDYLVAAPTGQMAEHILDVDRSPEPHALELGLLLGYPECCARATAAIGEACIDDHAIRLGSHCDREQEYYLDPRGYQAGVALVSYVACSPRCSRAMRHANAACAYIAQTTASTAIDQEPWITWRRTLESLLVNGHGTGG